MTDLGDQVPDLLVALLGGGMLATVVNRVLTRKIDAATVNQMSEQSKQIATETAREQVDIIRSVAQEMRTGYEARISELNADRESKLVTISKLEEKVDQLVGRVDQLEERERHMLTRAATHEAWDLMSFDLLSKINPDHPAPPPLTLGLPGYHPDLPPEQSQSYQNKDEENNG